MTGVLETECTDLNLIFNHWVVKQSPLLAAKSAITLDGRIACRTGETKVSRAERDQHLDPRAFSQPGIYGKAAADQPRPLFHTQQAQALLVSNLRLESNAEVPDRKTDACRPSRENDYGPAGSGMIHNVSQSFLYDSIET